MNLVFIKELYRLSMKRDNSGEDYVRFQNFQAEYVIDNVKQFLRLSPEIFALDYGCGKGGFSFVLAQEFKKVIGIDFYVNPPEHLLRDFPHVQFINADLLSYRGDPADFIFCASVIEHIPKNKQKLFVENLKHNLRNDGYLYLSFPPFYSVMGGHKIAPFHYLPDKIAFFLSRKLKRVAVQSYELMYGNWGLFKTTIGEVEKLLRESHFEILNINSRYMPSWYSRLFGKCDFLNWHAEFLAKN